jgi:hypothetical protein
VKLTEATALVDEEEEENGAVAFIFLYLLDVAEGVVVLRGREERAGIGGEGDGDVDDGLEFNILPSPLAVVPPPNEKAILQCA